VTFVEGVPGNVSQATRIGTRPECSDLWIFFNALLVTVGQKLEHYCSVLDIFISSMAPALDVEFGGVLFSAKARLIWHQKISRTCPTTTLSL
jgi:hypothetical protein